jgi:hypothetical protein
MKSSKLMEFDNFLIVLDDNRKLLKIYDLAEEEFEDPVVNTDGMFGEKKLESRLRMDTLKTSKSLLADGTKKKHKAVYAFCIYNFVRVVKGNWLAIATKGGLMSLELFYLNRDCEETTCQKPWTLLTKGDI